VDTPLKVTSDELWRALEKEPQLLFEMARKVHRVDLKILGPWMGTVAGINVRGNVEGFDRFLIAPMIKDGGTWQALENREDQDRAPMPLGRYKTLEEAKEALDDMLRKRGWTLL